MYLGHSHAMVSNTTMLVLLFITVLRTARLSPPPQMRKFDSEIGIQILRDKTEGLNMDLSDVRTKLFCVPYIVFLYTSHIVYIVSILILVYLSWKPELFTLYNPGTHDKDWHQWLVPIVYMVLISFPTIWEEDSDFVMFLSLHRRRKSVCGSHLCSGNKIRLKKSSQKWRLHLQERTHSLNCWKSLATLSTFSL